MGKKAHNLKLIPREEIVGGGPMNVFIRCKNKGCLAGIDWASLEDPKKLLEDAKKQIENNCPYTYGDIQTNLKESK